MSIFKKQVQLPDIGISIGAPGGKAHLTLADVFARGRAEQRALLMPFLVCGYPDAATFVACAAAAGEAGGDVLEVGIPFSDPIMDGPVIAAASTRVLEQGLRVDAAFDLLQRASDAFGGPVVAMTYYNLLLRRGLPRFAADCAAAGVNGVIVPDLTPEESLPWNVACEQNGISTIYLASSTSSDVRLARIAQTSEGFVYAASTLGVTGVRASLSTGARDLVERIRKATTKPVAVGIGVSTPEQAAEVATYADGVIVGSALIKAIDDSPADPAAGVRALVAALRTAITPRE